MLSDNFRGEILVNLTFQGPLRVGRGRGGTLETDLPVTHEQREEVIGRELKVIQRTSIPVSSFKGLVRNTVNRIMVTLKLNTEAEFTNLFGSEPKYGTATKRGKLVFSTNRSRKHTLPAKPLRRKGIRIDDSFSSVKKGALWEYEILETKDRKVDLEFIISSLYPMSGLESALLLAGLRALKYESFGGFGSRGMGIVTNVLVEPKEFVEMGQNQLVVLLGDR